MEVIMNSFYTEKELAQIGFKRYGTDVKISRKSSIYGAEDMILGNHVRVDDFCILSGKIEIGSYVHIAAYTALYGGEYGIFLDDFVGISSHSCVYAASDDYSGAALTNPTVPNYYRKVDSRQVCMEKHVLVGATSIVLPGVTLKEGSSFGSFSLITSDSEEWSINIGIPAHKIKNRKRDLLELEKKMMEEVEDCQPYR